MSTEQVRYVQVRKNKGGNRRWYWRRPGFPIVRLPDDPVRRFALVHKMNEQADRARTVETEEDGTVAWLIRRYRESDRYKDLASTSQSIYERWLREIGEMWGTMPPKVLTRRVVVTFVESVASRASRVQAAAVLYNVLELGRYYGLIETNTASRLSLRHPKPRAARWTWEDVTTFSEACDSETVRAAFYLLLYTAQRPIDVVGMRWSDYDGKTISLVQQKTGKPVEVPCHRALRAIIDDLKKTRRGVHIVAKADGRPIKRAWLGNRFREILRRCGLDHLQARDLRRTAITFMGEAGATEAQIASVSGHSIENTRQILETYLVRTLPMGQAAVRKWEENEN